MKQMITHWKKVERAENQDEKEAQFQILLQTHHPELLSSNINLTEHNCQILHNYNGQLQRVKREIRNKRKLETIEVCLNFMRIWILELTVLALDSEENASTII